MTKNNIHCLVINEPKGLNKTYPTLEGLFESWEGKVIVETINESTTTPSAIIKKLVKGEIGLLFIGNDESQHDNVTDANETRKKELIQQKREQYKNLLRRYSSDTILVHQSIKNSPLKRDLTGIENCSISLEDSINSPVFIRNLLRYTQLKKDFRISKRLLSITDKRNRWLVNITREPIAYIYKGTHIHANAAYLSLFGFHSAAELKSSSIWDLVPKKSHLMLKKFIKKQRKHLGRQTDMQQTLLTSMHTIDKTKVRAGIRIAPAVINNTQCLQIWIHQIEENLVQKIESDKKDTTPASPWENLPEKKASVHIDQTHDVIDVTTDNKIATKASSKKAQAKTTNLTFNGLRKNLTSVKLKLQPLTDTTTSDINHYLAKLQFDAKEQALVAKRLEGLNSIDPATFWDRMLLIELTKTLQGNQQVNQQYLLSLSEASLKDNRFITFLLRALKTLPKKHPQFIFLIPHSLFMSHSQRMGKINKHLVAINCSLGIYNFVPNKLSLQAVMKNKPSYINFSSKWIQSLNGDQNQLDKFSKLTDQLESSGIQVILS
ncbi:MAG: EAL domain-containing protein [Thiotrichaceae bacterium]